MHLNIYKKKFQVFLILHRSLFYQLFFSLSLLFAIYLSWINSRPILGQDIFALLLYVIYRFYSWSSSISSVYSNHASVTVYVCWFQILLFAVSTIFFIFTDRLTIWHAGLKFFANLWWIFWGNAVLCTWGRNKLLYIGVFEESSSLSFPGSIKSLAIAYLSLILICNLLFLFS